MVSFKTENYLRLLILNAQGATPVLRETLIFFVKRTSNKTLGDFLLAFQDLFKTLKTKHILSESEYKKLLKGSAVDINEWDTSLLCFVLVNCCTVTGKMHVFKSMLLKAANNDLDNFVRQNKAGIEKYKGIYYSSEQFNILFPTNYMATKLELWNAELITFLLLKVCDGKVQKNAIELLKATLQTEMKLKNSNLYLADFLKGHEPLLEEAKQQGELDESQFEQLFPPNGVIPDINKWDIHTLRIVVLQCTSSIKQETMEATKTLRTIRNECLAHRDNVEMSSIEYNDQSTKLIKAMKILITEENLSMKATIDDELETITEGPIEMKSTLEILRSFYTKESLDYQQILKLLDIVENEIMAIETRMDSGFQRIDVRLETFSEEMLKRFDRLEKKIPDSAYSETAEIRCVDMIIVVKSKTTDVKLKAESIIKTAMENAGQNSTEKMKAALDIIRTIVIQDGRTIVEIKQGSIIITIKCMSLKALHGLLRYVVSRDMKSHLQILASAVTEIIGETIDITVCLSGKSVLIACEDVIHILSEYVSYTSTLRMTIQAETSEELQRMVEEFKGASVKAQFVSLSEGLSTYLGEDITVDVVVPQINVPCGTTVTSTEKLDSGGEAFSMTSKVSSRGKVARTDTNVF